jgi:predicted metal-dependent phosphoesterase TrpH
MFKIDLHTHSVASPDGGISMDQYTRAFRKNVLDVIAITDHNRIDFALQAHEQFGDRIIVGEEIMSTSGEIIGLYLSKPIAPGLSPLETVKQIKDQGGVVYIPHPFESIRKGLHPQVLEELVDHIDIIEVCNGRAFLQNRSAQTVTWAKLNRIVGAASSDAHGHHGLGKTYTNVKQLPSKDELVVALSHGIPITTRPGIRTLLYPKYNKLRRRVKRVKHTS